VEASLLTPSDGEPPEEQKDQQTHEEHGPAEDGADNHGPNKIALKDTADEREDTSNNEDREGEPTEDLHPRVIGTRAAGGDSVGPCHTDQTRPETYRCRCGVLCDERS
jgi:hypothetical protein